jgi:hypothetical protein
MMLRPLWRKRRPWRSGGGHRSHKGYNPKKRTRKRISTSSTCSRVASKLGAMTQNGPSRRSKLQWHQLLVAAGHLEKGQRRRRVALRKMFRVAYKEEI